MEKYNHKKIESKWAEKWVKDKTFTPDLEKAKDPYYALFMFPYPSAEGLHIGNFYAFICVDVMAKYKKLQGKDVFEPIGFDAFGMHSENYALKIGETPRKMLNRTIDNFRKQLSSAGLGCDWTREINTTAPEYYKWTQWIFTKLFEKGLAYQKEALLNWCPSCKTVLADEQIENGVCERCKSVSEKKTMKQWFLKITAYSQRLLDGLDDMDWSDITKNAQRNWIGRSEGAIVKFPVIARSDEAATKQSRCKSDNAEIASPEFTPRNDAGARDDSVLEVFTTRPDTLFGATYMVLSPEHQLVKKITTLEQKKEVEKCIKKTGAKSDLERTEAKKKIGVFTGAYAVNPVNNEKIPIWIADYVLMGYGTGAIMAVPAHDERDLDFAKKYNLKIIEVIRGGKDIHQKAYCEDGINVNSQFLDGLKTKDAIKKMNKWLEEKGAGKGAVNYKLRDWCISRQRYWGPPIPMIYCENCAKENKDNALILHGWEGSSKSDFIPSLKDNLISKGYNAFAFDAPDTDAPDFDKWFKFAESKIKENKLENLSLIGHSMGALLSLKLAEKHKIKKLILVAPVGSKPSKEYFNQFKNELTKEEMEIFKKYQDRNINIDKIKKNVEEIIFVFGKKDPWITEEIRNFYSKDFKDIASIHILEDKGHMSESEGVKKVEFLEDLFQEMDKSKAGWHPVSEKDLPVKLSEMEKGWEPAGDGRGPLAKVKSFMKITCPKCNSPAEREPDVMDNFLDSAWYYFRYISPHDNKNIFDKKLSKKWLPVDLYVGGNEHAVLHLMYTRFIAMAFHDLRLINFDNPFKKFRANGMILKDGKKMSKSKGNVVNPEEYGEKIGYDALKTYILFLGPLSEDRSFSDTGSLGAKRWIEKIARIEEKAGSNYNDSENLIKKLHQTIKAVTDDFESQKYNTAIARLMELTNALNAEKNISSKTWEKFLILTAPFTPALAEELWSSFVPLSGTTEDKSKKYKQSIFKQKWPKYDSKLVKDKTINLVVQINGKLRDTIEAAADISEKEAKKVALESEKIKKWIENKEVVKVIFVKGKLINIVVK